MHEAVLSTIGLTKYFGAIVASENISIELNLGEIHAIIGPNGAGKSTLISQICGNMRPDAGSVFFRGVDVTRKSVRSRAKSGLARSFQISALAMEDTVLQNATLGALGASGQPWRFLNPVMDDKCLKETAFNALESVGLTSLAYKRAFELSHGQRRQLEIAIALTLKPKAFLMDEPMAGLGSEGSFHMTTFLNDLRKKAPILLVEHDMDAVFALADRISVLVYGKIIASGTVLEIRSDQIVKEAYLGDYF